MTWQPLDERVAIAARALLANGEQVTSCAKAILNLFAACGLDGLNRHTFQSEDMTSHDMRRRNLHRRAGRVACPPAPEPASIAPGWLVVFAAEAAAPIQRLWYRPFRRPLNVPGEAPT